MLNLVPDIFGQNKGKIKGTVVLMSKKVLEFNNLDLKAGINLGIDAITSVFDGLHQVIGGAVSLQLISSTKADPGAYGVSATFNIAELSTYIEDYANFDSRTSSVQPRENKMKTGEHDRGVATTRHMNVSVREALN